MPSQRKITSLELPKIGKHLIETLTMGMYTDPLFVYREYIQNAADQIDVAVRSKEVLRRSDFRIDILIDRNDRTIRIEDNATGIKKEEVPLFLRDVANSRKDPSVQKGFRGIGRLGGLGYCKKLVFETSYEGERTKSVISMDAQRLRAIINDVSEKADAATVISLITTIERMDEKPEAKYFHVRMDEVIDNDDLDSLLDSKKVADYLSMVAPVPFAPGFSFADRIHAYFDDKGLPFEEYNVRLTLNDAEILKAYRDIIVNKAGKEAGSIIGIDFFTIDNSDGELIAIGWYGLTNLLNKAIPPRNLFGGMRLKKNNITIGDENTLKELFEADRFNLHFVGEVHVVGTDFVPNARRDKFNESETLTLLRNELKNEFRHLVKLSRFSSDVWSRYREIKAHWEKERHFDEFKAKPPISAASVKSRQDDLANSRAKARVAKEKLEAIERKNRDDLNARAIFQTIISDANLEIDQVGSDLILGEFRLDKALSKLDTEIRATVLSIFGILDSELWVWETERIERLKLKIVEELVSTKKP